MPNDHDAQALQSEANQHLAVAQQQADAKSKAELERQDQLKRPGEVFDALCQQNADAGLFMPHELKTDHPAGAVAVAIAKSLLSEPNPFELLSHDSPKPDTYEVTA